MKLYIVIGILLRTENSCRQKVITPKIIAVFKQTSFFEIRIMNTIKAAIKINRKKISAIAAVVELSDRKC